MGGSVGGGSQTSDAFQRERETHYEILSPFQDDGAAYMNLAGGSRQGKRIGKVLDASHRRLVKVCGRFFLPHISNHMQEEYH